jgi:GT2 family glycosyltransferase
MRMNVEQPFVSVIIPSFNSEETLYTCLDTISAQDYPNYEVILVDSSPEDRVGSVVRKQFPEVKYIHSHYRLFPHAARNRGAEIARGDLFLFTDPDIYVKPDWISSMVKAYLIHDGLIVGSLKCHGCDWINIGHHLSKFDIWLPGGKEHPVEIGPTANLLCNRVVFEEVGGFDEGGMLGDTSFSWTVADLGIPIWFIPNVAVEHHHTRTWRGLLVERYLRAKEYALIRTERKRWGRTQLIYQILISVFPLRWAKLNWRVFTNALRAGMGWQFLQVSPIVLSANMAWLFGEARYYWSRLCG